jgi:hypothetical protein
VGWGAFATLVVPVVLILTGAQIKTATVGAGAVAAVTAAIFVLVRMTRLSLPALGGDATEAADAATDLHPPDELTGEGPDGRMWSPGPGLHDPWPVGEPWPEEPLEDLRPALPPAGLPLSESFDPPWRPDHAPEPRWPRPAEVSQLHERVEYGFRDGEPGGHRWDQQVPPEYPPVGYATVPPHAPRHSARPLVPPLPEAPVGPSFPPPHHFDDRTAGPADPPPWHGSAGPPPPGLGPYDHPGLGPYDHPGLGPYDHPRHEPPPWDIDAQPGAFSQPRATWLPQPTGDELGRLRPPDQRRRHRRGP